jgi:hypothetical protein
MFTVEEGTLEIGDTVVFTKEVKNADGDIREAGQMATVTDVYILNSTPLLQPKKIWAVDVQWGKTGGAPETGLMSAIPVNCVKFVRREKTRE